MDVVRHQNISMYLASACRRVLPQQRQIDQVVGLAGKTRIAIVPALNGEWTQLNFVQPVSTQCALTPKWLDIVL